MDKKRKAVADCAVSILSNVAVVGIGLAIYDQRWWSLIIATFTAAAAFAIAWRSSHD